MARESPQRSSCFTQHKLKPFNLSGEGETRVSIWCQMKFALLLVDIGSLQSMIYSKKLESAQETCSAGHWKCYIKWKWLYQNAIAYARQMTGDFFFLWKMLITVHTFRKFCPKTEIACLTWSVCNSSEEENDIEIRYSCHFMNLCQNIMLILFLKFYIIQKQFACLLVETAPAPQWTQFFKRKEKKNQVQKQRPGVSRK